ncbi:hypothetical protein RFN28_11855 [Mesorhizobium sp. VK24D]|uniref:Uncharacterized protein n=1 Tax=Mesorhizobium album TaxID=3072314 RepID=A0ABU4XZ71_9HYPH|nr:hypothetical protein [Mesorhizobium sp. VK24D]MDX8479165.1 hypothetical protein [Mesorhizobium sp. VK24D]
MKAQHSSIGHDPSSSNVAGAIFAHPRRHFIGRDGGRPPVISLVEPMRHIADKMQIWRRNFLSIFSGCAQFGGRLRMVSRQIEQLKG